MCKTCTNSSQTKCQHSGGSKHEVVFPAKEPLGIHTFWEKVGFLKNATCGGLTTLQWKGNTSKNMWTTPTRVHDGWGGKGLVSREGCYPVSRIWGRG